MTFKIPCYVLLFFTMVCITCALSIYDKKQEYAGSFVELEIRGYEAKSSCAIEEAKADCRSRNADCYDDASDAHKYVCVCKKGFIFDDEGRCRAADCQCKNGRCVTDNRGKKKCICNPRHSHTDEETCWPCDCGPKGKCIFTLTRQQNGMVKYEKKCICDKGSAEKDGKCVDCHCGPNSKCEFEDEDKICYCEDGFSEKDGVCTECNCGEFGECRFQNGKKQCICHPGYVEEDGTCKECDCGDHGECLLQNGNKVCKCHVGYQVYEGFCVGACQHGDCLNGGVCIDDGECHCSEHISGVRCENVDCDEIIPTCIPSGGTCEFDEAHRNQTCRCYNDVELFHPYSKKCEIRCEELEDGCLNGGMCNKNGICECKQYVSGAKCEQVNCEEVIPKCEISGGRCEYDVQSGHPICRCLYDEDVFHPHTQQCERKCDENSCLNGGICSESGVCECKQDTTGVTCEQVDCVKIIPKCEASGGHCTYDKSNGVQICSCTEGDVFHSHTEQCEKRCDEKICLNGGECSESGVCECKKDTTGVTCEQVDCEKIIPNCETSGGNCKYDGNTGDQICNCKEGDVFHPHTEQCEAECTSGSCQNGGYCDENGICKCQKHTSGIWCENVDCAKIIPKCETSGGHCNYDKESGFQTCICGSTSSFHPILQHCRKCDCGNHGVCEFLKVNGSKSCECYNGYQDNGGECEECNCGRHGIDCAFHRGEKLCTCNEGFSQRKNECYPCECGEYSQGCRFEDLQKKCYCKKGYVEKAGKCEGHCTSNQDCLNGGRCRRGICECLSGTSGDLCDVTEDCEKITCSEDSYCTFDVERLIGYCKCFNKHEKYDSDSDRCKRACNYDDDCSNGGSCNGHNSYDKFCDCLPGTSGDTCDNVVACDSEKYRHCNRHFNASCVYDVEQQKAKCLCNNGKAFDDNLLVCRDPCKAGDCQNEGMCMDHGDVGFCVCRAGTSGDFCATIDECNTEKYRKCIESSGYCTYDVQHQRAKCVCKEGYTLDETSTTCEVCDCGKDAISCSFKQGVKICDCKKGYGEKNGMCQKLTCTETPCLNGKCDIINGQEVCKCFEGYVLEKNNCRKMNCTRTPCINGTCVVRKNNKEQCVCPAGFTLVKDTCKRGVCKITTCYGGKCETVDGELVCVCPEGFHQEGNGCYETVCQIHRCFGGKCVIRDGKEICACKEGYELVKDVCKMVLCKKKSCFGGKCKIVGGKEECICPAGFSIYDDVCRAN